MSGMCCTELHVLVVRCIAIDPAAHHLVLHPSCGGNIHFVEGPLSLEFCLQLFILFPAVSI